MTSFVIEDLTEEECYLYAILSDHSGVDQAEFLWNDQTQADGCWRAWSFQVSWWRNQDRQQIEQSARCVKEGSLVFTENGWIAIEKVKIGQRVLTHKNRWRQVLDVFDNGVKEVVAIKGQGTPESLVVTRDHKIWARHAVRASKPKDGHKGKKLLDPAWMDSSEFLWSNGSGQLNTNWASPSSVAPLPLPEQLERAYKSGQVNNVSDLYTPEWMWLYGLFLAEGSTYIDQQYAKSTWSVHIDELEKVKSAVESVGLNYHVDYGKTAKCATIVVNSRPLAQWLRKNAGHKSYNKEIAPWVYGLDEPLRRQIFDGMIFGDGHERLGKIEYTTVSRPLILGFQLLANTLGYSASVYVSKLPGVATIEGRTYSTRKKYAASVTSLENVSRSKTTHIEYGQAWSPIKQVEPAGIERTWDLEVDEDHSFVVEGKTLHNSLGKSMSIMARACAFPLVHPGQEMVITAPELVHLEPIVSKIEAQMYAVRLYRDMLVTGRSGVTHRPFQMNFLNQARIIGRIPQKDGRGVKGLHPVWLEMDEGQDYPHAGWVELTETVNKAVEGATWRVHGVTRGVRDDFYKHTKDSASNPWTVHRYPAMCRPTWTDEERQDKIAQYGGRDDPDYRRNVLGLHGDSMQPIFVLARLMACFLDSTPIKTINGTVRLDSIQEGDLVANAIGYGRVKRVTTTEHSKVVVVKVNGEDFVCSEDHRFFTQRGWVEAKDLTNRDSLVTHNEAVRGMWGTDFKQGSQKVLWSSLQSEVAWSDLPRVGYQEADIRRLRMVSNKLLSPVEGSKVLFSGVRSQVAGSPEQEASRQTLRMVQGNFHPAEVEQSILHTVLSGQMGECHTSFGEKERESHDEGRSRWFTEGAISTLASFGGTLGSTTLAKFLRRNSEQCLLDDRYSPCRSEDCGGGRWKKSPISGRSRFYQGSMVDISRVESVEIHESGSEYFNRLSGGEDTLTLYDLTVSGHPSFVVGESEYLVHNCADDDVTSDYNSDEYTLINVKAETLTLHDKDILDVLQFPPRHLRYLGPDKNKPKAVFWVGMDIGLTRDPSEILVFVEYRENPKDEYPKLKLLTRISMTRISTSDQTKAILSVIDFYKPKVFALDRGGIGLPFLQTIKDYAENPSLQPEWAKLFRLQDSLSRIKGYNFGEKIIVEFDPTVDPDLTDDLAKDAGMRRNTKEYGIDKLRELVDNRQIQLPWDEQLLGQFQGGTVSSVSGLDQYGKRRFAKGDDHTLDAAVFMTLGFRQYSIEEFLAREEVIEPVYDVFISL